MIEVKVLLGLCCWCWVLGVSFSHDLHSQALPSLSPALTSRPSSPSSFSPSRRPSRLPTAAPSIGVFPPTAQYSALNDLYEETAGWQWTWSDKEPGVPWNFSQPADAASTGSMSMSMSNPCAANWQGVKCSVCSSSADCVVLELNLPSHNLTGSLPMSLGNLSSLESLDLHGNELQGSIPESLGLLKSLKVLSLARNRELGGSIPDIFYNMTNLMALDLSHCKLHSTLPSSIYTLNNLTYLELQSNYLYGSLSSNLSTWRRLVDLQLGNNNFTGSLPNSIGNLLQLETLTLRRNQFTSTLPNSICSLSRLTHVEIAFNKFSGSLPKDIGNLKRLEVIDAEFNLLDGSLPPSITELTSLRTLLIPRNFLTGTISKDFQRLKNLQELMLFQNVMYGPVPDLSASLNLTFITLGDNAFTGEMYKTHIEMFLLVLSNNLMVGRLPFPNSTRLATCATDNNFFTGTLPAVLPKYQLKDVLNRSLSVVDLYYLNVSSNYVSGTIPKWLTTSPVLSYGYLFDNSLTGTLPATIGAPNLLNSLYLGDNYITGSIPSSYGQMPLISLQLRNNLLHGTIPVNLFDNDRLTYLFLQKNRLSGQIPEIANKPAVASLQLLEVSNNLLTGSIPTSYFASSTFQIFSAAGNCLSASLLPDSICQSKGLTMLALDGMSTASECRVAIFPHISAFTSFTLKRNVLSSIPTCLFAIPTLQSLHLSGNALLGSLPHNLNITKSLTNLALSHNRLSGKIPEVLQQHSWTILDLSYNRFSGNLISDFNDNLAITNTTTMYLDVNRISGMIPSMMKSLYSVSILNGNMFACDLWQSQLPNHDPKYTSYSCGSDSVNKSLFTWVSIVGLLAVIYLLPIVFKQRIYYPYIVPWSERVTMWLAELKTPTSSSINNLHSNSIVEYITLSEFMMQRFILLTVLSCAALIPLYQLLTSYAGSYVDQYIWTYSAVYLSGVSSGVVLMFLFLTLLALGYYTCYVQVKQQFHVVDSTVEQQLVKEEKLTWQEMSMYAIVILIDITIMVMINVGYVVGIVYEVNQYYLNISKLVLAAVKLVWNDYMIWSLLQRCKSVFTSSASSKYGVNSTVVTISRLDMMIIVGLVMFNNLIAPCLSVAIINPQCFYNAFIAANKLDSYFNYCISYIALFADSILYCTKQDFVATQYDPPFIYNYNCASLLPVTYVEVYVYMMLMIGFFIPVMKLTAKVLYDFYLLPTSTLYHYLDKHLPLSYRRIVVVKDVGTDVVLFDKYRFVVRLLSFVAIVLSVGMIFPILAGVSSIALFFWFKSEQIILGKMLYDAKLAQVGWYREQLEINCRDVVANYLPNVMLLTCIASGMFAALVFDTIGDDTSFKVAIAPTLIVLFFPVAIYYLMHGRSCQKEGPMSTNPTSDAMIELMERPTESYTIAASNPMHHHADSSSKQ